MLSGGVVLVVLLKIVENGHNGNENMKRTSVSVSRTMKNERTSEGLALRSDGYANLLISTISVSRNDRAGDCLSRYWQ